MGWAPFQFSDQVYDLSHLASRTFKYTRPESKDGPAETFHVEVRFTLHCFSRGIKQGESYDPRLIYPDHFETRLFDFRRYEMSKRLPVMIQNLPKSRVRHNKGRRNYFTVEMVDDRGKTVEYDIFFKVKKLAKGRLEMIVESAFVRDPAYGSTRPDGRPVRFWIILHNTLHGLSLRT